MFYKKLPLDQIKHFFLFTHNFDLISKGHGKLIKPIGVTYKYVMNTCVGKLSVLTVYVR